jgi:tRNA(Ile)-lysidine synthase
MGNGVVKARSHNESGPLSKANGLCAPSSETYHRPVHELETRIEGVLRGGLLPDGCDRLLVGVSGGLDSMALLHLLHASLNGRVETGVLHVNHGLRGRASAADERLVRNISKKLKLPFFLHKPPVRRIAHAEGISLEMAARDARHRAFVETAKEWKCGTIALGHHRDDQIELLLLRLLRGAGAGGLGGMEARSPSAYSKDLCLVRPLLDFDRTEIAAYAVEKKIRYREDASNQNERIPRNRVRMRIVPLLREMQPALGEVVGRSMELLRAEDAATAGAAELWLAGHSGESFADLPLALRRHVVRKQLFQAGVVPDFELVETLIDEIGMVVNGPDGSRWELDEEGRLKEAPLESGDFLDANAELDLREIPLSGEFEGGRYDLRYVPRPARLRVKMLGACEYFDADTLGERLILRHWQAGDRYHPIGMCGTAKLQDVFVNNGVPREERRTRAVLATGGNEIIWVEGLRIGDQAKVVPDTRRFLRWMWRRSA